MLQVQACCWIEQHICINVHQEHRKETEETAHSSLWSEGLVDLFESN